MGAEQGPSPDFPHIAGVISANYRRLVSPGSRSPARRADPHLAFLAGPGKHSVELPQQRFVILFGIEMVPSVPNWITGVKRKQRQRLVPA
jgi:hypothetical protein